MDANRFKKLLSLKPELEEGDETNMAENPRNWLADKVNPVLDEYVNPVLPEAVQMAIPKMTIADEKNYRSNLPESMAGAAMGTINTGSRFGKLLDRSVAPKKDFGTVTVKPSKGELLAEAQKAEMVKNGATRRFQKEYIDSGLVTKKRSELSTEDFNDWINAALDKFGIGK